MNCLDKTRLCLRIMEFYVTMWLIRNHHGEHGVARSNTIKRCVPLCKL